MSFRRRVVLLAAGAVATAIVLASVVVYVVTRDELRKEIDASLQQKITPGRVGAVQIEATRVAPSEVAKLKREGKSPSQILAQIRASSAGRVNGAFSESVTTHAGTESTGGQTTRAGGKPSSRGAPLEPTGGFGQGSAAKQVGPSSAASQQATLFVQAQGLGGAPGYVQLIQANGEILRTEGQSNGRSSHLEGPRLLLPVTAATRAVAAGRRPAFYSDVTISGTRERMLTERAAGGGVWEVALPLTDINRTLVSLKLVLALVSLGGIVLAALLGVLVSRAALVPVRRLTAAAERVARTQDLGHRIPTGEEGELGRLAASFNTMLAALERP
jgi:two-component system sensor histidine kinase MprB